MGRSFELFCSVVASNFVVILSSVLFSQILQ